LAPHRLLGSALRGREEEIAGDVGFQELRKLYSTMLYCYRSRDWEGALVLRNSSDSFATLAASAPASSLLSNLAGELRKN